MVSSEASFFTCASADAIGFSRRLSASQLRHSNSDYGGRKASGGTQTEGTEIQKNGSIQIGNTYKWRWFLWDGTEEGKITKLNDKDHIQFTFAGDCLVDVHLEAYEKGTIVSISQSNIPTDDKSKKDIRLGSFSGWSFYLINIKSIYEGGLGLRNKDAELKAMLNT